jgi:catechol 2,3-dioxygenase-like lactoylglutathione lyase family enzyme
MSLRSYTHVALRVERLREAETFYRDLFALEVAFREAETPDGWQTLPPSADWEDAEGARINLGLVMLHRDGFRLALEAVEAVADDGRLSHLGVLASEDELDRLRVAAPDAGCEIANDRPLSLIFDDPLGVRWEFNTFSYDDPPSLSTGVRNRELVRDRRGVVAPPRPVAARRTATRPPPRTARL